MNKSQLILGALGKMVLIHYVAALIILSAMFFIPAWTLTCLQAWVYLVILFTPMLLVMIYVLKNDPELLARKMRTREKETEQKLIAGLSFIRFILAFLLSGFDIRLGWSYVPAVVVVIADNQVTLGYGIVFLVFRENCYRSRVIEVEQGQKVISRGPCAMVRHPMHLGFLLLDFISPLALGSYWAVLPALLTISVLVARICNEEMVHVGDLQGYREYKLKTRFRLIPGIWWILTRGCNGRGQYSTHK